MTSRARESGFGLLGFLILLPFLLSVLAVIYSGARLLSADARLKHDCRTSVLNSQRDVAGRLRELLALNREAESLRAQREAAEKAVRAALLEANPALATAAELHLAVVTARQIALAARQRALIIQGQAKSFSAPVRARTAVLTGLATVARENEVRLPTSRVRLRSGAFAVIGEPKDSITPSYHPAPRFTERQVVEVDVEFELASILPEWLLKLVPAKGLELKTHCQATIERQENEWIETLNAVR